jgi:hypothetical protein
MAGCDRMSHYHWLREYPDYRAAFERAREPAADVLEDEAVRRAVEGVEKPVTVAGQKELIREYSDQVLMFLLKGRRRAVFGDKSDDTLKVEGELSVAAILRARRLKRDGELSAAQKLLPAASDDDELPEGAEGRQTT